jgi:NADH:ubiquinone oxidoreductase subunit D
MATGTGIRCRTNYQECSCGLAGYHEMYDVLHRVLLLHAVIMSIRHAHRPRGIIHGTSLGDVVMVLGTVDVVFGAVDLYRHRHPHSQ